MAAAARGPAGVGGVAAAPTPGAGGRARRGDLSDAELALAWDVWIDRARVTNDADPPYSHGVFQLVRLEDVTGSDTAAHRDASPRPTHHRA